MLKTEMLQSFAAKEDRYPVLDRPILQRTAWVARFLRRKGLWSDNLWLRIELPDILAKILPKIGEIATQAKVKFERFVAMLAGVAIGVVGDRTDIDTHQLEEDLGLLAELYPDSYYYDTDEQRLADLEAIAA